MSHSTELVKRVAQLLQKDYPADDYKYVTECAIPKTRMMPDIQVWDRDKRLVCVAEIGYTRPEKLTAYRKNLKIPDVRWYDKSGKLHADVQERVARVTVKSEPEGTFSVFKVLDLVPCMSEACEGCAVADWNVDMEELTEPMTEEEDGRRFLQMIDDLGIDVCTLVITDYLRVWFVCYCDKCGTVWKPDRGDAMTLDLMADLLDEHDAKEFSRSWGERIYRGAWKYVAEYAERYLGVELIYEDGNFVSDEVRQSFAYSASAAIAKAERSAV